MSKERIFFHLSLVLGGMLSQISHQAQAVESLVFISSFAAGEQGAIQAYQFDTTTGSLKSIHRTGEVEHPFFFVVSRDQSSYTRFMPRRLEVVSRNKSPRLRSRAAAGA